MPIHDDHDALRRLRARPAAPSLRHPGMIDDFRPVGSRSFPKIGRSLPPRSADSAPRSAPPPSPDIPVSPRLPATDVPSPSVEPIAPPIPRPLPTLRKAKKRRRIITKKRIALLLVLLLLAGGGWFGYKAISNLQKVFHGGLFSVLTTTKLKGENVGRVNILLAGNSADDPGHDGANLTDSIMMISIDTKHKNAFMLSIPRDMWVDIPGYGHAKINEAYVDGQSGHFTAPGYPNGGMGLLEEVVEQNFGLKADYYALIDYNALRDAVNAVGGIDVNIQSEDPRGLYDPSIDWVTHGPLVKLSNGVQHLNGEQALDLARARGDAYGSYGFPRSDFDRTEHQRLMILALKSKILSADVLANPVKLSGLFDSIGKNIRTDFTLSEVRRLYDIGKNIANNNIRSVGLNDADGVNLLANYTSPTHQSTLIPAAGIDDFSKIQAFLARLTSDNLAVREGAKIVVLNATDTAGLAADKEKVIVDKQLNVTTIGDAASPAATTTIIDMSGGKMPATLALLKNLFGPAVTTKNPYAGTYDADFIVVVGKDQVPKPAATSQ